MNIPQWARGPLIALGVLGSTAIVATSVKDKVNNSITISGTPTEVEAAIRTKFPDKKIQDAVIESLERRLAYIADQYPHGRVTSIAGGFYVDEAHGNSLFPDGFDHSQRAQVEITDDQNNGSVTTVDYDVTEVPQSVTDNIAQKEGQ